MEPSVSCCHQYGSGGASEFQRTWCLIFDLRLRPSFFWDIKSVLHSTVHVGGGGRWHNNDRNEKRIVQKYDNQQPTAKGGQVPTRFENQWVREGRKMWRYGRCGTQHTAHTTCLQNTQYTQYTRPFVWYNKISSQHIHTHST